MIGEYLFRLAAQETISAPVIQRFHRQVNSGLVVAAQVSATLQVPDGFCMLLKKVSVNLNGGAAQPPTILNLFHTDEAGNTITQLAGKFFVSGVDYAAGGVQGNYVTDFFDVVLLPREIISAIGTFSAGAVGNRTILYVMSLLVPRGNIQIR